MPYDQEMNVLVIKCDDSTLEFTLINPRDYRVRMSGTIELIGLSDSFIQWQIQGKKRKHNITTNNYEKIICSLFDALKSENVLDSIVTIGHYISYGGEFFTKSVLVTDFVLNSIKEYMEFDPLYNSMQIFIIKLMREVFEDIPNAMVFDTAFHQTLTKEIFLYPIPLKFYEQYGVRKYGSHGLSYQYVSQMAVRKLNLDQNNHQILITHLDKTASVCAIKNGSSIDITTGLTPLEGLLSGTSSGSIDINIFSFLNKVADYSIEKTTKMLNDESGLCGLSGISNQYQILEKAVLAGNLQAKLAIDIYCKSLSGSIASFATQLDRIDALIFTGDIGENSILIREEVMKKLSIFGFQLDKKANQILINGKIGHIATNQSIITMVIPNNEELCIAMEAYHLIIS